MYSTPKAINSMCFPKPAGEKTLGHFKRYLIVGFLSFGLEYFLFFILYRITGLGYIAANSTGIFMVFWFNYLLNRYWTFRSKQAFLKQIPLYAFVFFFNIVVSNLLMFICSNLMGITPFISKVLSMGFIVIWNFLLYTKVVYKS